MSHNANPINRELKQFLKTNNYSNIAVLVDENTNEYCLPLVSAELNQANVIEIKSGEENKILKTCNFIWEQMTQFKLSRNSLLINLGGGVIGDMGGFCAATYKRGIDFINIPTTLLSQVDASVGGKLGIDFNGLKNHIGLFKEPKTILSDPIFLKTLPKRELKSGFAEMVKHALIGSIEQWNELKLKSFDSLEFEKLIPQSVAIKQKIVESDPFEKGRRKVLNFGHTIGHAIESFYLTHSPKLLHGEAIVIGMVCESQIANKLSLITDEELKEISAFILGHYSKTMLNQSNYAGFIELMTQDKKNKDNKILVALPKGIGNAIWDVEVSQSEIIDALDYYRNYQI